MKSSQILNDIPSSQRSPYVKIFLGYVGVENVTKKYQFDNALVKLEKIQISISAEILEVVN